MLAAGANQATSRFIPTITPPLYRSNLLSIAGVLANGNGKGYARTLESNQAGL
jgi:hypothetical protein